MKKIFQLWLFLFIASAFLATLLISWTIETRTVDKNVRQLLELNIDHAKDKLDRSERTLKNVRDIYKESLISATRITAQYIARDPKQLESQESVDALAKVFKADELAVTDARGVVVASYPSGGKGFDMATDPRSAKFLPAVSDPEFALAQDPRPNAVDGVFKQYCGVARIDEPGVVILGLTPRFYGHTKSLADLHNIASEFLIGRNGGLIIYHHIDGADYYGFDEGGKYFRKEFVNEVNCLALSALYKEYVICAYIPCKEVYAVRAQTMKFITWISLGLFIIIFFLISALVQLLVVNGIYRVNDSLDKITKGDLEERVAVTTAPEFVVLSNGVNRTVGALKKAIEKEAKRIDDELHLCHIIQHQFLPSDFANESRFNFDWALYTAREVGGDFYDFFYLDEDRFVFLIADVSGKGMTAAFFMMSSKAYLRRAIKDYPEFVKAIAAANAELVKDNTTNMFLTGFFCIYNARTRELTCVNAGHNPPLLRRNGKEWEYFHIDPSIIIGVMPDATFDSVTIKLEKGDEFFLYTDGVSEAMNTEQEAFGEKRLREALNLHRETPEREIELMRKTLKKFRNGEPRSDDVTMLHLMVR